MQRVHRARISSAVSIFSKLSCVFRHVDDGVTRPYHDELRVSVLSSSWRSYMPEFVPFSLKKNDRWARSEISSEDI